MSDLLTNEVMANVLDNLIAPGGHLGRETPDWPYSDNFALQRMRLGASLTVFTDREGGVIRYTIHHIGEPYKLTPALGERLLTELPMTKCWEKERVGIFVLAGKLTLYQVD